MQPNFDALYRAIVTSNVDTSSTGKIKVQCPQIAGMAEIRSAEPVNPAMPVPAVGSIVWVGFSGGDITKPFYMTNLSYLTLDTNGSNLIAVSPTKGTNNDGVQFILVSGVSSAGTGGAVPHVTFRDTNGTTLVDLHLSGNIVPVDNVGNVLHWNTISSFGTGWAQGTGAGGAFPNLQWRFTAEDEVQVQGTFHCTSTSPNPVIATGFPSVSLGGNVGIAGAAVKINTTTSTTITCYMNANGELRSSGIPALTVNDTFGVNFKVPLGNLS